KDDPRLLRRGRSHHLRPERGLLQPRLLLGTAGALIPSIGGGERKVPRRFFTQKTRPMAGKWPVGRALRSRQRMAARGKVLSSSSACPSGNTPSEASALCSEVTAAAVA